MESLKSYGIDYDRLVNKDNYKTFDGLIKCKNCFNILVNPHDCEKCGNTFCYKCINSILVNNKHCPYKCENFSIKPSSLAITSYLSSLKFTCVNKVSGCEELINYMQLDSHDKECPFSFSTCPNVKCSKTIRRQLLEFHVRKECEFTLFKCQNCQNNFNRNDFKEHFDNCKIVSSLFDLHQPIIDTEINSYEDIPLKDLSLKNFMQMILFQLGKTNSEFNKKIENISTNIQEIKENLNKQTNTNSLILENVSNELEIINERILHLEGGLNVTSDMKKMIEDNVKDNLIMKESITNTKNNIGSKENSINSSTNNSNNNSKNNSVIINSNAIPHSLKKSIEMRESNVKKFNLRMTNVTKNLIKSPERSPVNINRSLNQKTYNVETESFQNKTNNITLLKSMIRNQETLLENLNKIFIKVDKFEKIIESDINKNYDSLKQFINSDVVDEIKSFQLQTSFDISERIIKKFEDNINIK